MLSVIMTAYNAEKYIEQALQSIFMQTYKDIEVVVVDDCSTDRTPEIAQQFDIKYIKNKNNMGHTKSLNVALGNCSGEYVAWHDADDISRSRRFEKQVKKLRGFDIVTTYGVTINESGKRINGWYTDEAQRKDPVLILKNLTNDCWLLLASMMFKKEIIYKIGMFDEECYCSQDLNFIYRAMKKGYKIGVVKDELFKYRKHKDNIRSNNKYKTCNWHEFAIKRAEECLV